MGRKIVLGVVLVAGAAACAILIMDAVGQGPAQASYWAAILAAMAGVAAAPAAVVALMPQPVKIPLPPELHVPDWVIERPTELGAVVEALVSGAGTVGITTGLYGAGGFGKTTLAQIACADRRVRKRFGGRVFLVTVGRDLRGPAAISAKVNDVIKLLTGEDAAFTDPELAGRRLGSLLDAGPRRLLVLDDVWESEQLVPFTQGGKRCSRLVTTRVPELLAGRGVTVKVDQMSPEQARTLLTMGLPRIDPQVVESLLAVTGRWPLLLRLVSQILADYAWATDASASEIDLTAQSVGLLDQIRTGGPAIIDKFSHVSPLDVGKPSERAQAVRLTIEASTSLLDRQEVERFSELGIFAENEAIPFSLMASFWEATGGLGALKSAQICKRLTQLALVSQAPGPVHGLMLHSVVRDFLFHELSESKRVALNASLIEKIAMNLPAASPLEILANCHTQIAWWELSKENRYLWDHLIEHLIDAERSNDAEALAADLRWVGARLEQFGPAAPAADLAAIGSPRTVRLRATIERTTHLLGATVPASAVVDILHSRVSDDPDWGPQAKALRGAYSGVRLVNRWPLPDLANSSLRRVLSGAGRNGAVLALAAASDGSWLSAGGRDRLLRVWDAATGQERLALEASPGGVMAVAGAPGGSWLASGGLDGIVRIWDAATGTERAAFARHKGVVTTVAVAQNGTWLASSGWDGKVRVWDPGTGQQQASLEGHNDWVTALVVSPDGSWLASGGTDGTVRVWDTATWGSRGVLTGHKGGVTALAVVPDGGWLASGGTDGSVRVWDTVSGETIAVLTNDGGEVAAVVVSPDGSWLASGGTDGTVRVWDTATWGSRGVLTGHKGGVTALAVVPGANGLASGGWDGAVRIWDMSPDWEGTTAADRRGAMKSAVVPDGIEDGLGKRERTAHIPDPAAGLRRNDQADRSVGMRAVAVAPGAGWLASAGDDGMVRIWDVATGLQRAILKGHSGAARAVAVAPDGSWLVSGGDDGRLTLDGAVRIWDVFTGEQRAVFNGRGGEVAALSVAPDGSWLASGSWDGAVRIWDVVTGEQRAVFNGRGGGVAAVAALSVAPDGSWLASGSTDGVVRIWDVVTGRQRAAMKAHTGAVWTVAIGPDGSWLASGSWDGAVRIWSVATGEQRICLDGHTDWVTAIAVSQDGGWLASGGGDGAIRIWDVATGQALAGMRLDNSITSLAWVGGNALAVTGPAGLYLFGIVTSAALPTEGLR